MEYIYDEGFGVEIVIPDKPIGPLVLSQGDSVHAPDGTFDHRPGFTRADGTPPAPIPGSEAWLAAQEAANPAPVVVAETPAVATAPPVPVVVEQPAPPEWPTPALPLGETVPVTGVTPPVTPQPDPVAPPAIAAIPTPDAPVLPVTPTA